MIRIDEAKCKRCNLCFEACPDGIIARGPQVRQEAVRFCVRCGHCAAICPQDAISIQGFEGIATPDLPREAPVSAESMMALLRRRRSGRLYDSRQVERRHLEQIVEAASLAPSAMNARPVKAYVCAESGGIEELRARALNYYRRALRMVGLPGFPVFWRLAGRPAEQLDLLKHGLRHLTESTDRPDMLLYGAPAVLAFTAPRGDTMGAGDAMLAAQNAALFAETLGVATCFNGFTSHAANANAQVKAALHVPRTEQVVAVLTLGYPRVAFAREAPRNVMPTRWF